MKTNPTDLSPAGRNLIDRRQFFNHTGTALGGIALANLLADDGLLSAQSNEGPIRPVIDESRPLAARQPHFAPKAKNVLVIFCAGALSHIDSWDYKPELIKYHDKPQPGGPGVTFQGASGNLHQPLYKFRPRGQSGKMVSDLLPKLAELTDEMCFVHSLTSKSNTHGPGENFMSTGFILDGFPSIGAWISYALGSENSDLPAFVAIPDPRGVPGASLNNWGSGFLPAVFQGTAFSSTKPIQNLARPSGTSAQADRSARDLLKRLNERHLERFPQDTDLTARIASYELAARMQLSAPEVTNLSSEPKHVLKMYGADDSKNTTKAAFARNCILARRLIERGVRFVQLFNGAYPMGEGVGNWDGHRKLKSQYDIHAEIFDQPAAALLTDMKQRGLLADTLVVWCTEFGRQPTFQKGASGRDHNIKGFTGWLTGAGVKAPYSYGATDQWGYEAVQNPSPVYDFHATILHLLGLDHERLSFYHNGLERRLTDVHGHVIKDILA